MKIRGIEKRSAGNCSKSKIQAWNFKENLQKFMRSLLVSLFLSLSLLSVNCLPHYLDDSQTVLSVNSSFASGIVNLMFEIKAEIGTEIKIISKALSASVREHTLKVKEGDIEVTPPMSGKTIIFNNFHEGSYWMALSHTNETEGLHFIPLQMQKDGRTFEMMLPVSKHPMPSLPLSSFYRCGKTLVSVHEDPEFLHVGLFSHTPSEKWMLNGNWNKHYRHSDQQWNFGCAMRNDKEAKVTVSIGNGDYCEFYPQELPKSTSQLDEQNFYTVNEVLTWAPKLNVEQMSNPFEMEAEL